MFESFLYSSEAWGNISEKLLKHERTALKRILCVNQSTPDDIVYCEVMRPDIKSIILERQYKFLQKLLSLTENEAITKRIWSYYCQKFKQNSSRHCHYNHYTKLQPDAKKKNMDRRKRRVANSDETMCNRYRSLCSIDNQSLIYSHMINDRYRITLTRWRLSCHKLYIETGGYKRPIVDGLDRRCIICQVVEDEFHALFMCYAHVRIRLKYTALLTKYDSIQKLFNPRDSCDLMEVSKIWYNDTSKDGMLLVISWFDGLAWWLFVFRMPDSIYY